jgi:hypothetical protein
MTLLLLARTLPPVWIEWSQLSHVCCSICDFVVPKNGRFEGTVHWHQIFLKRGENIKEAYKTSKTFGELQRGTANFSAVFLVICSMTRVKDVIYIYIYI